MSPGRLLQYFDQISEAPDAVPRLRRFVLDLAVRGKLVAQEPADEPAAKFLRRLEAERDRLVAEGTIKEIHALPEAAADDTPYDLPKSWEWERFGKVAAIQSNLVRPHDYPKHPHIAPDNIESRTGRLLPYETVRDSKVASAKHLFFPNHIIYSKIRPNLAKATIVTFEGLCSADAYPILSLLDITYLLNFMLSDAFVMQAVREDNRVAMPKVNQDALTKILVPVPPLAEQQRIVAKVDELMALCDELEAAQAKRERRRDRLVAATLHGLNNGDPPSETGTGPTFEDSARFYFNHLPRLTTRPEHIQQLRQTILNLAVRGKLVPQDPNDEPASELLRRIEVEKQRLTSSGRIGKHETLPTVGRGETLFEEPSGWTWARLLSFCEVITKGSSPRWQGVAYTDKKNGVLFITSENVGNFRLFLENRKYVQKRFNEIEPRSILARNDILLNLVGASIGRSALFDLDEIANINQAVCIVRTISRGEQLNLRYLLLFLNSEFGVRYMFDKQVDMARANLSMTNVGLTPVPLPPLAEQHRIVAKVDELMGLCDELETRITAIATVRRQLLEVTLAKAPDGKN